MKKMLTLLGTITLIGTSTTGLVACNTPQEYTPEELEHLKKENQIDTKDQTIRDNLEWIAPQETPFNNVDNKYYYVVWHGDENNDWMLSKFKNDLPYLGLDHNFREIKKFNKWRLGISNWRGTNLYITESKITKFLEWKNNDDYFKSIYLWNLDTNEPDLIIDDNGNLKVKGE